MLRDKPIDPERDTPSEAGQPRVAEGEGVPLACSEHAAGWMLSGLDPAHFVVASAENGVACEDGLLPPLLEGEASQSWVVREPSLS